MSARLSSTPSLFRVCASLAMAAVLGGCARGADTFQPRIMITSPESGAVTGAQSIHIKGYVLDDTAPTKLTVNGEAVALDAGSDKIKFFSYQPSQGGANSFELQASDGAGNQGNLVLNVDIDAEPPTLSITAFERFGETIRLTGTATDNDLVQEILIDGRRINITQGKKVTFYAETQGIWADLTALDRAGNKVERRAQ